MFSGNKSKSFNLEAANRPKESWSFQLARSATEKLNQKLANFTGLGSRKSLISQTDLDNEVEIGTDFYAIDMTHAFNDEHTGHADDGSYSALTSISNGINHTPVQNGHVSPQSSHSRLDQLNAGLISDLSQSSLHSDESTVAANGDAGRGGADGSDGGADDAIEVNTDFIRDLVNASPLPRRYKLLSQQTPATTFALITSAVSMYLYGEGGLAQGDWRYPVGGITVNFTQNVNYGMATYWFYLEAFKNLRKQYGRLIVASAIAILATVPLLMATYFVSKGSFLWTALQLSAYPINVYGMASAIEEFLNLFDDNSHVRKFLMEKFKDSLVLTPDLLNAIPNERALITRVSGLGIGVVLGTFLTTGMFGYICDVAETLLTYFHTDLTTSYLLSFLLFNFPSEVISFLCSGINMGLSTANSAADLINHLRGIKPIELSPRDKKFTLGLLAIIIPSIYAGMYSDGTSKVLYGQCTDFFEAFPSMRVLEPFLKFSISYGSQVFNWIMHSFSIKKLTDYICVAYSENPSDINLIDYLKSSPAQHVKSDRMRYQAQAIANTLKYGDAEQLEKIADDNFPQEKSAWEKPPKQRLGLFHRRSANDTNQQQLLLENNVNGTHVQRNGRHR